MSIDAGLVEHYGGGELLASIEAGLDSMGLSSATATVDVLGPVDEFHIGGRPATTDLCARLGVDSDTSLVDIGCGIGGAARFLASTFGCSVTGVDLAPNYIAVAQELTEWTGLSDRVQFEVGSALGMPFDDDTFDGAVQLHVGMNIEDKGKLCGEVFRTLRPGGRFGLYDIMRMSDDPLLFPLPWAADESMSFVDDLPTYRMHLEAAGFEIEQLRNRSAFATEFFAAMRKKSASNGGPAPLGLHIILGQDAPLKLSNMVDAINAGTIAPVEIICRKPA
jgi:ubiquinone/menaquinone biosynthesis C-methylase UbiE